MWRTQTRLGAIPYYMFVERDTGELRLCGWRASLQGPDRPLFSSGAKHYFEVPLARAFDIYKDASKFDLEFAPGYMAEYHPCHP